MNFERILKKKKIGYMFISLFKSSALLRYLPKDIRETPSIMFIID